jgi:16S rRNA (adenine1518-N6/adenine1519-N6)-dimethyltransferase
MRRFEVRPDRDLGQNFLVDSNILEVIGRDAELAPEDVVLEIGGGLGVLSEYLATRVRHVHVVELDTRLRDALLDATESHANISVHWGDAMKLELDKLCPSPRKLVANLPYGIAARVLLRTIEGMAGMRTWVAMVQREVGVRLASAPGGGEYGASSVIAQLACEVRVLRAIPRAVFFPEPNVDSVLLGMRRVADAPAPQLRALVAGSFAHRRKTLVGSLLRSPAGADLSRDLIQAALRKLGEPLDVRAERLSPRRFSELGALLTT